VEAIRQRVSEYYGGKVRRHGMTPRGVDWESEPMQRLRFVQLLKLFEDAPGPFSLADLGCGYGAMLPFIAWGVLADFLKNVAITAGPSVASQLGFAAWQREAIAFAYQFGALILPAVVPAVLWVALHGRFLAPLRRASIVQASATPPGSTG